MSKIRIDIFPFLRSSASSKENSLIGNTRVSITSAEDLFINLVSISLNIEKGKNVAPKYFQYMDLLGRVMDSDKTFTVWERYSISLQQAIAKSKKLHRDYPDLVQALQYKADENFICTKCDHLPLFPIAKAKDVISVLDYI